LHAEEGSIELKEVVDTLITIPNERLLAAMGPDALLEDSFRYADDVLCQAVQGISDIITMPGIVNVDFADVRTIMSGKGMALMGTGVAEGENRAVEAAQRAISSPLLEENLHPRRAGSSLSTSPQAATACVSTKSMPQPKLSRKSPDRRKTIFGAVYDEKMGDRIKITVIATRIQPDRQRTRKGAGEHIRAVGNVIPLTQSDSNKMIDYQLASIRDNLDEPAFRRRRAE